MIRPLDRPARALTQYAVEMLNYPNTIHTVRRMFEKTTPENSQTGRIQA